MYLTAFDNLRKPFRLENVVKLKAEVYGLKQALIAWFRVLLDFLVGLGYTPNEFDCCVVSKNYGESFVTIAVYVGDLILVADIAVDAVTL
jgi:Reverse transcriptase (RNA-dependent DNA polymerase)